MADEINYLDLIVLRKMDAESTVEKFGSTINTSFFETANLLGTMKIKGLVDIHSSIAGHSPLVITGEGQDFLALAMQKASEPLDALDRAALSAIGAGMRDLNSLQQALNVRGRDLALHLHKLKMQDYIDHEVRSSRVILSLTEKGFILAGNTVWRPPEGAGGAANAAGDGTTGGAAFSGAASGANASGAKSVTNVPATKARSAADDIEDIIRGLGRPKSTPAPATASPIAPGSSIPASAPPASAQARNAPAARASSAAGPAASTASPVSPPRGLMSVPGAGSSLPASAAGASPSYGGEMKLDRTTMLLSKLEFYLKAYLPYAILLVILLIVIVVAVVSGLASRAMGQQ